MNVFELRERLVGDYADYTRSFIAVRDERIRELVESELESGLLWPDPIIQLNPAFEPGEWIDEPRRARSTRNVRLLRRPASDADDRLLDRRRRKTGPLRRQ